MGNITYVSRLNEGRDTLAEEELTQRVLRSIRQIKGRGYSLRLIAERLNEKGHRRRAGNEWGKTVCLEPVEVYGLNYSMWEKM